MRSVSFFAKLVARAPVARSQALLKAARATGYGCVLVGVISYPSAASAYRTLADIEGGVDVTWAQPTVPFVLRAEPVGDLSVNAVQSAVIEGVRMWNSIECSSAAFDYRGLTLTDAARDDSVNTIQWIARGWDRFGGPQEAAVTDVAYTVTEDGGTLMEFDIYLNAQHFGWVSGLPTGDAKSIQTVVAHEAGHALGILHPCEGGALDVPACEGEHRDALMHPEYSEFVTALGEDDRAAVCHLYPGDETHRPDDDLTPNCEESVCRSGDVPLGDPCESHTDCYGGLCDEGGYCQAECRDSANCAYGACKSDRCVDMKPFGAECEYPSECLGRLCLQGDQGTSVCSRSCGAELECPFGWECAEIAGQDVCTPEQEILNSKGCGCWVGPGTSAPLSWSMPIWLALATWVGRRRCRAANESVRTES